MLLILANKAAKGSFFLDFTKEKKKGSRNRDPTSQATGSLAIAAPLTSDAHLHADFPKSATWFRSSDCSATAMSPAPCKNLIQ